MITKDSIKECIKIIEEIDHLNGLAKGGDGRESNDVTEVDGDPVKIFWFDRATRFKCFCH